MCSVVPGVTSVRGTSLNINSTGISETAWEFSGGGLSAYYSKPSFQAAIQNSDKRNIPDVSYSAIGFPIHFSAAMAL